MIVKRKKCFLIAKGGSFMKEKTKQEKIIDMLKNFLELSEENQVYVSGIVHGIAIQKDMKIKENIRA